jgi:hypothetical protein
LISSDHTSTASDHASRLSRALRHLEWSRVADAWLARCSGQAARRIGIQFSASLEQARQLLAQTAEAAACLKRR